MIISSLHNKDWNAIMFNNIGHKIKTVARISVWVGIICTLLLAAIMLFIGPIAIAISIGGWALLLFPLIFVTCAIACALFATLGCVQAWLSYMTLYAFGELVEMVCLMKKNTDLLTKQLREEEQIDEEEAKVATEKKAENRAEAAAEAREAAAEVQREAAARAQKERIEKEKQEAAIRAGKEAKQKAQEEAKLAEHHFAEKLRYALRNQSDDDLVNYLKCVDDPRVYQILKSHPASVREEVKKLLETL